MLPVEESEALQLWSPEPMSARTRERVGSFIAVAEGSDVLHYDPTPAGESAVGNHSFASVRGFHAGLAPDEMRIPLLLA